MRSNSAIVSFKLKEGHIVQKVGDDNVPKGIMHSINKGSSPEDPSAKDVTVVFLNQEYFTNKKTVLYTDTTKETSIIVSSDDCNLAKQYNKTSKRKNR